MASRLEVSPHASGHTDRINGIARRIAKCRDWPLSQCNFATGSFVLESDFAKLIVAKCPTINWNYCHRFCSAPELTTTFTGGCQPDEPFHCVRDIRCRDWRRATFARSSPASVMCQLEPMMLKRPQCQHTALNACLFGVTKLDLKALEATKCLCACVRT